MKILHLSDTHSLHRRLENLPEADVLVHCMDFTMNGTETEEFLILMMTVTEDLKNC